TKELLRQQANQLPEPTVLRLIDLLAGAVEDMRQGGGPRLPLELAIVKVTRPNADLSRESLAHRVEVLEGRVSGGVAQATRIEDPTPAQPPTPKPKPKASAAPPAEDEEASGPGLELEQVADAWQRSIV